MTERNYRLETDSGLSKQYSLKRLQEKHASGSVGAFARCTPDNGETWISVSALLEPLNGEQAVPEMPAKQGQGDSESAAITHSETALDFRNDHDGNTESQGPSARRLKRLPAGSGTSKMARLHAARNNNTDSILSPAGLIGVSLASGRYQVTGKLGKGSMAYVLLASDSRLLTDVVVKVPKPEKMTDEDIRVRFRRESQLLVQLSHPHVVKVLDVGEYRQLPYVVMQYLSGGTLTDRIMSGSGAKKGLPPDSLKLWLREVARALDFCCRKGMVHRDVKPANILFDEDDNAYVSDFGLTKIMYGDHDNIDPSDTASGVVLGTPNYISPEVVLGRGYDGRADQYSLGITVYHALYGKPPMQGDNATATMINQTQKQLQLLSDFRPDVPRELALAVRRSIEKDPEKRFNSCEQFADAVLAALAAPAGRISAATVESVGSDASLHASSQSSVSRKRVRKKRGARSSRSASPPSVDAATEVDWYNHGMETSGASLPPRKSSRSRKSNSSKSKSRRTVILGHEVHPGLVITLGAATTLLVLSIIIRGLFSGSPDTDVDAPVITHDGTSILHDSAITNPNRPVMNDQHSGSIIQPGEGKLSRGNSVNAAKKKKTRTAAASEDVAAEAGIDMSSFDPEASLNAAAPGSVTVNPTAGSQRSSKTAVRTAARTVAIDETSGGLAATGEATDVTKATPAASLAIPYTDGDRITTAATNCPVLVIGNRVWDKAAGKFGARLEGTCDPQSWTALSADGRYFAAAAKVPNQQKTDVIVWDTATGRRLFTATGEAGRYTDSILLSNRSLFVGGRWAHDLMTWDCTNGNAGKALVLSQSAFPRGSAAVSSDGSVIAAVSNSRLGIVQTQGGKIMGTMQSPEDRPRITKRSRPMNGNAEPGNAAVYESLTAMAFSVDNQELAAVATHPVPRLMCWNSRGELLVDRPLMLTSVPLQLQWLADGRGWLIEGQLIERETGRVLVTSQPAVGHAVNLYDERRVVGKFSGDPRRLQVKNIPWSAIKNSMSQMHDASRAILAPGTSAGLQVKVSDRPDLKSHIERAMKRRLDIENIKVSDDVDDVSFIVEKVTDSDCLEVSLMLDNNSYWSVTLKDLPALGSEFNAAAESDQAGMIEQMTSSIMRLVVPYYVPKNAQECALPVVLR